MPSKDRQFREQSRRYKTAPGFTLIEILIVVVILGILAAIVVPQFSNASLQARENTLKDELRYLRTQIVVFKAHHRDVAPGYPGGNASAVPTETDFKNQMTMSTDELCNTNATRTATYRLGPYLTKIPANQLNGLSTIKMVANDDVVPSANDSTGWIYKAQTQEIYANSAGTDRDGNPYAEY